MASVTIANVKKGFGDVQVLHGVDITVPAGSFTVLVGPSGCGKSTLLRVIAGLESISDGEIRIADTVVNRMPPKERDIAMVLQNDALYPHMTVRDSMAFSLSLAKADKAEIDRRVGQAAGILALDQLLDRIPRQLSGGQRQRVTMGRAIVRDPQVFLFDEPLSNLDAMLRVAMRTEIKELQQRLRTTSIYVTHDQIEAMTMADQIVVMHDGRVEQVGSPLDLFDRPANRFVAGFIGSPAMNFIDGRLQGGQVEVASGARLDVSRAPAASDARPETYGIRPDACQHATPHQIHPARGGRTMTPPRISRRSVLSSGGALAGTATLANLTLFAKAWAQSSPFKPEKGAKLQLPRWKRFIQSEEDSFMKLAAAFQAATGVEMKVVNESLDDVQPKASVAANTNQGPDIFWGLYSLPHLFPTKCVDESDVAGYLAKKYGGWVPTAETYGKGPGGKWIAIHVAFTGNVINYRQSMIEKAGFKEMTKDTVGFLEPMKALKAKSTPGGFTLGRASGDGNARVHWALWSHGAGCALYLASELASYVTGSEIDINGGSHIH